jgi:hypothetical protein
MMLVGCKNLVVTDVRITSWTASNKSVTATIENKCWLGSFFCRAADNFTVYFDGEEVPTSATYRPQVSKGVPHLGYGDEITLAADFTPLARIENNYLWNVTEIRVTADPKNEVSESSETDNVKVARVPFSSELPIVVIDALGGTIVNEPKIRATMKIIYDYAGGRNFRAGPANDYDDRIGIELRGQLSASFCKRQYGFEPWDQNDNDFAASLLQLPAGKDWVLYGPYDDKTLIRNVLTYGVSNVLPRYAPRTKLVEVFVLNDNGTNPSGCPPRPSDGYAGVYVVVERIKRGTSRVNVASLSAADNAEPAVTGGYILKKDWLDPGDAQFTTSTATGYGTPIIYVYPKCKISSCNATAAQRTWIEQYMNNFEAALKGPNFADPNSGYAQYIDVDSFVDYYLLQELFKNSDGFRGSTYMYKDRSGKLKMGPLWDMNFTMGNVGWAVARPPEGWLVGALSDQMKWWPRLLADPAFAQKVINRWTALRQGPFKTSILHLTIDNWARYLRYAQARNFQRWPVLGVALVGNPTPVDPNETYGDAVQQIKTWIDARATWIDNNIGAIPH